MGLAIEIRYDGVLYAGSFDLDAKPDRILLTVSAPSLGSRTTELRDAPPRLLAMMILRDLVERQRRRAAPPRMLQADAV
jgi:hypothetical protein